MQRIKLILVLAVVVAASVGVTYAYGQANKVVVLNPVRTVTNQVSASTGEADKAVLRISSGNVSVLVSGETDWQAGVDGMEIVTGTRIKTDATARASVEYPGGTVTRMDHESEILVEMLDTESTNIVVRVFGGRIWSRVSKILGKVSYESRSTNVVASVRGTEYEHDLTSGIDNVMVAESSVDVFCINGKKKALLKLAEKMAMDCGDGSSEIKETITSETIPAFDENNEDETKIEFVDEEDLDDDWSKFNGAREVLKKARQKNREESLNSSQSGVLALNERIKGESVDDNSTTKDLSGKDEVSEDFNKENIEKAAEWWSKIARWRTKNTDFRKETKEGVGRLKLKCEDDCSKLVLVTEREFEPKTNVSIEILKDNKKRIDFENTDRQGRVFRGDVKREDICSGGEFELKLLYENGSQVEYGKFNSSELECNK